ncbi:hypothetical protein [Marinicella sp. W31]|uniref:hypothetical protein n=1 Tax=Marinicella sp. W31 TaxID=3023713 RepID=UPI0037578380
MKIFNIIAIILACISFNSRAEVFCVADGNSQDLQAALTAAQDNNQDNVIKIAIGEYVTPNNGFRYVQSKLQNGNLEITGGWSASGNDPCAEQLAENTLNTILDGQSQNRVLRIFTSNDTQVKISNLIIANGKVANSSGGGLAILTPSVDTPAATFKIENNLFINNEAEFGGAISVLNANKTYVQNNLVVGNNATEEGSIFAFAGENAAGIYFTNNTVVNNTSDTASGGALIRIAESNALIANNLLWNNDNVDLKFDAVIKGSLYIENNNIGVRTQTGSAIVSDLNNFSLPPRLEGGFLDFTPLAISPLVNQGTVSPCVRIVCSKPIPFEDDWFPGETDVFGNPRIQNGGIDIGAFESPHEPDLIFMNGYE